MAKGFEIAEGYLGVDADVTTALKDVRRFFRDVENRLDDVEKEFKKSGKLAGEDFADGATEGAEKGAERTVTKVAGQLRDSRGRFAKAGADVGEQFSKTITESIQRRTQTKGKGLLDGLLPGDIGGGKGFFGGLMSGAGDFFGSVAKGLTGAFSAGIEGAKSLWQSASSFFQQAGNIGGGIGSIAMFAGMASLVPVILALGGALMQLSAALFALPAAAGVAIAIIAPLVIAFKGFGEAVGAGLSGDTEAFNEALKKLAPSARTVAKEFVSLGPALKDIKKSVQGAFFQQLIGFVKPLGTLLLPMLNKGLTLVATSLGKVAAGFLDLMSSDDIVADLRQLFETTGRIVDRMGPSMINLFGMLFGIMEKGLPWVEKFFGIAAEGIDSFSAWLSEIQQNGQLESWLKRAWELGGQLWDVLKGAGELIATIFGETGDEGSEFLVSLAGQLKELNEFFKSDDGKQFIDMMASAITGVILFGAVAVKAIILFGKSIDTVVDGVKTLWRWLVDAWDWISEAVPAAGRWFADLGKSIWGWVVGAAKAVAGFFVSIGEWFASAWDTVVDTGGKVVQWFADLPGKVWEWLQTLPGLISDAWTQMYEAVLFGIGFIAGSLVKFFLTDLPRYAKDGWNWLVAYTEEAVTKTWARIQALPGQIAEALSSLWGVITGAFSAAWDWAVNYTKESIAAAWEKIKALPGQIWSALSGLGSMISGFFSDAWTWAKDATATGIDKVMEWIKGLPGKVKDKLSDAKSWLYNAGGDILRGLADGLKDTLGWAVDRAKAAANKIKDGFLSALGIKSPSRVMRLEVGRQLLPGVAQGIDDTLPGMQRYLGTVSPMLSAGMRPDVNVGGPTVNVDGPRVVVMLDGREIAAGIILDPGKVAAATDEGRRQRGWAYSPRAKS